MASPGNQHCASCIGTLSIPLFPPGPRVPTRGPGGNRGLLDPNPNSLLDPTKLSRDRPKFGFGYGKKERSNYGFGRNVTSWRPKPAVTGSTA